MRVPLALGAWIVAGTSLGWGHAAALSSEPADTRDVAPHGAATLLDELASEAQVEPALAVTTLELPETSAEPRAEAPATRYAALTNEACESELVARAIPHRSAGPKRGVAAPVRLTGPLHEVSFHTLLPSPERGRSSYELFDCRLLLALDDLDERRRFGADLVRLALKAFRRPIGMALVARRHMVAHGRVLAVR